VSREYVEGIEPFITALRASSARPSTDMTTETERGVSPERWAVEFDDEYTRLTLTQGSATYQGPWIYTDMIQLAEQREALLKEASEAQR